MLNPPQCSRYAAYKLPASYFCQESNLRGILSQLFLRHHWETILNTGTVRAYPVAEHLDRESIGPAVTTGQRRPPKSFAGSDRA